MKKRSKYTVIAVCILVLMTVIVYFALSTAKKDGSSMKTEGFQPNGSVTTREFVTALLDEQLKQTTSQNESEWTDILDYAHQMEITNENDIEHLDKPILRQDAARIAHQTLTIVLKENDEQDTAAANSIEDLFSCKTCVMHIAQVYVKGIMSTREDGLFHGNGNLMGAEAEEMIKRVYDVSLREPKTPSMFLPEDSDDGAITPDNVLDILATDNSALLIDVRSYEEYNTGYIPASVCVPLPDIQENLAGTIIPQDKETVLILYCQMGGRSAEARRILKEAGYTKVYNLGGVEDWPYDLIK